MTTASVASGRHRSVRVRPRFQRVRVLSVKIPKSVNALWDASELHPRLFLAALFAVVAVVWGVRSSLGAVAFGVAAGFVVGRGVGLVRLAGMKDKLAKAERERDLFEAAARDRDQLRADLTALTAASTRTQRMTAVEDGEER